MVTVRCSQHDDPNYYRDAEGALKRTGQRSPARAGDLAKAQLQAMLAVADELRNVYNELIAVRNLVTQLLTARDAQGDAGRFP
jgi:hypothetical protein